MADSVTAKRVRRATSSANRGLLRMCAYMELDTLTPSQRKQRNNAISSTILLWTAPSAAGRVACPAGRMIYHSQDFHTIPYGVIKKCYEPRRSTCRCAHTPAEHP